MSESDKVIPFITSVVNDIYEKISELNESVEKVGVIFEKISENFQKSVENIAGNIKELLKESGMNRDLALEAFSDSMNALLTKIQEVQEENEKNINIGELKSITGNLSELSEKFETKFWDIQMMLTVSNLHSLVDVLKSTPKIFNVPTPTTLQPAIKAAIPLQAVIPPPPTQEGEEEPKEDIFAKSPKFKAGRKVKTHDDRLKEIERKKKLFGKY